MKRVGMALLFLVAVVGFASLPDAIDSVLAQSGSRGGGSGSRGGSQFQNQNQGRFQSQGQGGSQNRMEVQQTFEDRFWRYLVTEKYRNWAPVPGESEGAYEGQSPHGAYLKMYLNRRAAGNPKTLPDGSLIVKENYGPDQKTLMAVTVMYRSKGYNVEGGDWYWVKYNPDGTVAEMPGENGNMRLAGVVGGCIKCHGDAAGGDFAFFNDEM